MATTRGQSAPAKPGDHGELPGQVVLVLQGGGALGAFQVGVYQAMHEAGIEPDWVIGTSIGAINGAIIAGNRVEHRLERLTAFWETVRTDAPGSNRWWPGAGSAMLNLGIFMHGVPGFFAPNPQVWWGLHAPLGVEQASYYDTAALRTTLVGLVDFERLKTRQVRLSLGAVGVAHGKMRYFDSRDTELGLDHIMASGALPPAFPAVRIDGEPYWDGGIYSNTPVEAVLDDNPRRDSVIFAVQMWNPSGPEPESLLQVLGRQKEIQYASRAESHLRRQDQIHRLRHVIRELTRRLPDKARDDPHTRELESFGCATRMHLVNLLAPRIEGEDLNRDIDFTSAGVRARREAGYAATRRVIEQQPWRREGAPLDGIIVHDAVPEVSPRAG
ncbi:MAG: patatin-like phospholipase family protein [Betaproteobacteria bacterium]|nr:MAG: patatin-like phospholipase family protein [Betaproteobacteria bacterium]